MFLKQIKYYLIITISLLFVGLINLFINDKTDLHLSITSVHSDVLDLFFTYYTEVGHGITCAIVVTVIAIVHYRNFFPIFLAGMTSYLFTGLIAQLLKRQVFPGALRPKKIIGEENLHLIDGIRLNEYFSFPSGHATTTFMMFTFLALVYWRNRSLQIVFAILALVGAFSRVYTSQHFLEDILAGGFIGIPFTLLIWGIYRKYTFPKFFERHHSSSSK